MGDDNWPDDWSDASLLVLSNARDIYWAEFEDVGTMLHNVVASVVDTQNRQPLGY